MRKPKFYPNYVHGEKHHRAKLDDKTVQLILAIPPEEKERERLG